jgi:hypothetical protein
MASLVLNGSTSGSITISSPAVSGSNTLTLPASTGTVALTAAPTFTGQATIPTINLTGGQITFPATQSASADANTLDDYEEGTWTPSIGGNATYFSADTFGFYTKIGNLVTVHWSININAVGTGQIYGITNLPFTSAAKSQFGTVGNFSNLNSNVYWLYSYTDPSTTNLFFGGQAALDGATDAPINAMKNSTLIYGTFVYRAA